MEHTGEILIAMAVVAVLALAGFALYRWRQYHRVRQVEGRVRGYLVERYGSLPDDLRIDCSEDESWPVLVSFHHPQTGSRHNLQIGCWGPASACSVLAEQTRASPSAPTGP